MADLARALQTPVPATQPAPQTQQATKTVLPGYDPAGEADAKRAAKNKRDQERRKAKRATDLKAAQAAEKKAAAPKKKKRKAKKKVAAAPAPVRKKARGRGRPPGSKNKPKAVEVATVLAAATTLGVPMLDRIHAAVALLNAMPEHARKVVLDAVK